MAKYRLSLVAPVSQMLAMVGLGELEPASLVSKREGLLKSFTFYPGGEVK